MALEKTILKKKTVSQRDATDFYNLSIKQSKLRSANQNLSKNLDKRSKADLL
jgi:hypothetical protein